MLLEKSAEIQSVVRGLRGQIKGLEDRGCSGGRGGRCAGGVLRGQGYRRTVFSHQDLTEDDGQQDKEQPFGRVRFLDWQLTPDHSWVEDPTAALSMPAGGARARSGGHRGLRERVEGEDLGTGAPSGSRAGGGDRGRSPQDGHGGEGAASDSWCWLFFIIEIGHF